MKAYFAVGAALIAILIATLLGYGVYLNQRGEHHIAERMENMRVPLTGVTVRYRELFPVREMDLVNLYSDEMTDVVVLESGRITEAFVEKNSHVLPGQPILMLVNEDIPLKIRQADSDILEAEAQLIKAENSYKRYAQLMEWSAVSAEKYDEAEATYKASMARLENCRAQREQLLVRQDRLTVTSPIEGEVLMLYKKLGAYVTAGTAVALVGDFKRMLFTAPVEDRSAQHMDANRELDITFEGSAAVQKSYGAQYAPGNLGEHQVFHARVAKISPPVDEPADVRQVVWEIDNSVGILEPGVYPHALLRPKLSRRCLTVPLEAVTNSSKNEVAVLSADGTLQRRGVVTGANDGHFIEIIRGLEEGDVVLISDTEGLKEGIAVDVKMEEE